MDWEEGGPRTEAKAVDILSLVPGRQELVFTIPKEPRILMPLKVHESEEKHSLARMLKAAGFRLPGSPDRQGSRCLGGACQDIDSFSLTF